MELQDFNAVSKKIGFQTVELTNNKHLKIKIDDEDLLNFKADADYTVQVSVCLLKK